MNYGQYKEFFNNLIEETVSHLSETYAFLLSSREFSVVFILLMLCILIYTIYLILRDKKLKKEIVTLNRYLDQSKKDAKIIKDQEIVNPVLTVKEAIMIQKFLTEHIKNKFDYFLYKDILPIYNDKKIPELKLINRVKTDIFLSITAGLSQDQKKLILKYFSKKGIEMLINERVIILFNRVDYTINKSNSIELDVIHTDKILPMI